MIYQKLSNQFILNRLEIPEGKLNIVLDTDAYNEIDDQFAIMYVLRSTDRLNVQAIYAAPFSNERAETPGAGMEKSYAEIHRVLEKMGIQPSKDFVLKGSDRYLGSIDTPCKSEAALDLIHRAMSSEEPLYVVAIGAITNIVSAILIEPRIIEKIVVIWLGGHALYWPHSKEFNLNQDIPASQVIFDCGVPLIQLPCMNVVSHLHTTLAELERYMDGKSPIGSYLTQIFREYTPDHFAFSKTIWDVAAIAYLINSQWVPADLVHSPILTEKATWSVDHSRHFIKSAVHVDRDAILRDLFSKV